MPRTFNYSSSTHQRGAVLVVSMLLLLVMTVLALGASQSTRMQERMAGSARNYDLALQSAEAGLRSGERFIDSGVSAPFPCLGARCGRVYERGTISALSYQEQAFQARQWWTDNGWSYDASVAGPGLAANDPQYYVEELEEVPDSLTIPPTGPPPSRIYYRITSRGEGGTSTAQVVLQTTYARRFN